MSTQPINSWLELFYDLVMILLFGHYLKTLSFLCIITVILFVPVLRAFAVGSNTNFFGRR
jgi:hypothetical protein